MQNFLLKYNISIQKILLPFFAIFIFISTPLYDNLSKNYINSSLTKSAITYATLRGLNAAVSVIQESTLTFGIGVEANIAIGQAVDPINDAIERFSDMITLSIWALGSEKIIYELSKTPLMILIVIILSIMGIFIKKDYIKKILMILIIARIFIPFSALISDYTYQEIFKTKIELNLKILSSPPKTGNSIESIKKSIVYYTTNSTKFITALLNLSMLYFGRFVLDVLLLPLFLIYLVRILVLNQKSI
ncbi:MAG: hypothetical protein GXP61_03710 [Epsilonproteobacteria bacterium]|nr:hypothetical protein [Campylobacterota bacterium]